MATREDVLNILKTIKLSDSGEDIVSTGMMRALNLDEGRIRFVLEGDPSREKPMQLVKS